MKNQFLMEVLAHLYPEDEVCIQICDVETGELLSETYDISFSQNEYKQLVLKVNIEQKTPS